MTRPPRLITSSVLERNGIGFDVNANRSQPLNFTYMEKIVSAMENGRSAYSKLTFLCFTLHCSQYSDDNTVLTEALPRLKEQLDNYYQPNVWVNHLWCREQDKASAQHYHLVIILNGQKASKGHRTFSELAKIWCELGQAKVTLNQTHHLKRADDKTYRQIIYHLSYMAKMRSKRDVTKGCRDFVVGRIKTP